MNTLCSLKEVHQFMYRSTGSVLSCSQRWLVNVFVSWSHEALQVSNLVAYEVSEKGA